VSCPGVGIMAGLGKQATCIALVISPLIGFGTPVVAQQLEVTSKLERAEKKQQLVRQLEETTYLPTDADPKQVVEAYLRGLLFLHSDKKGTPVTSVILSKIKRQHIERFWDSSFVGSRYLPIDYVQYRHIRPGAWTTKAEVTGDTAAVFVFYSEEDEKFPDNILYRVGSPFIPEPKFGSGPSQDSESCDARPLPLPLFKIIDTQLVEKTPSPGGSLLHFEGVLKERTVIDEEGRWVVVYRLRKKNQDWLLTGYTQLGKHPYKEQLTFKISGKDVVNVLLALPRKLPIDLTVKRKYVIDRWLQHFFGTTTGIRITDRDGIVLLEDNGTYGPAIRSEDTVPFQFSQIDAQCRNHEHQNNFYLVVNTPQRSVRLLHGQSAELEHSGYTFIVLALISTSLLPDHTPIYDAPRKYMSYVIVRKSDK